MKRNSYLANPRIESDTDLDVLTGKNRHAGGSAQRELALNLGRDNVAAGRQIDRRLAVLIGCSAHHFGAGAGRDNEQALIRPRTYLPGSLRAGARWPNRRRETNA